MSMSGQLQINHSSNNSAANSANRIENKTAHKILIFAIDYKFSSCSPLENHTKTPKSKDDD